MPKLEKAAPGPPLGVVLAVLYSGGVWLALALLVGRLVPLATAFGLAGMAAHLICAALLLAVHAARGGG